MWAKLDSAFLTDPRLAGWTAEEVLVYLYIWTRAEESRTEHLPARFNVQSIHWMLRDKAKEKDVQSAIDKAVNARFIDITSEGRIYVYGFRSNHRDVKGWKIEEDKKGLDLLGIQYTREVGRHNPIEYYHSYSIPQNIADGRRQSQTVSDSQRCATVQDLQDKNPPCKSPQGDTPTSQLSDKLRERYDATVQEYNRAAQLYGWKPRSIPLPEDLDRMLRQRILKAGWCDRLCEALDIAGHTEFWTQKYPMTFRSLVRKGTVQKLLDGDYPNSKDPKRIIPVQNLNQLIHDQTSEASERREIFEWVNRDPEKHEAMLRKHGW